MPGRIPVARFHGVRNGPDGVFQALPQYLRMVLMFVGDTVALGAPVIEADNCVFHSLAIKNSEICRLDLALLETFTDSRVDHEECMARGGNVCRFKFTPKKA